MKTGQTRRTEEMVERAAIAMHHAQGSLERRARHILTAALSGEPEAQPVAWVRPERIAELRRGRVVAVGPTPLWPENTSGDLVPLYLAPRAEPAAQSEEHSHQDNETTSKSWQVRTFSGRAGGRPEDIEETSIVEGGSNG